MIDSGVKIIYFHGYGSNPNSDKVKLLRERFEVIAPSIPVKFDDAVNHLTKFIEPYANDSSVILAGTSLGGYWAGLMSSMMIMPAVLINPSCFPAETLKRYENSELTSDELKKYAPLSINSVAPRTVLLAKDDAVLDYRIAENLLKKQCSVKLFETGGHRFNDINSICDSIIDLQRSFGIP